ncbi:MAG: DUF378 domain-containing protein [Victivallaceae bacterium]
MLGKLVRSLAVIITIIGALNWGSFGLFQFDVIAKIFNGPTAFWSRFCYVLVGIAGIITVSTIRCICKCHSKCDSGESSCCHKDKDHHA